LLAMCGEKTLGIGDRLSAMAYSIFFCKGHLG
jgi:hypothetical protein